MQVKCHSLERQWCFLSWIYFHSYVHWCSKFDSSKLDFLKLQDFDCFYVKLDFRSAWHQFQVLEIVKFHLLWLMLCGQIVGWSTACCWIKFFLAPSSEQFSTCQCLEVDQIKDLSTNRLLKWQLRSYDSVSVLAQQSIRLVPSAKHPFSTLYLSLDKLVLLPDLAAPFSTSLGTISMYQLLRCSFHSQWCEHVHSEACS